MVRGRPPGRPLAFGRKLIPNEERVQGDPRGPGGPPLDRPIFPHFCGLAPKGLDQVLPDLRKNQLEKESSSLADTWLARTGTAASIRGLQLGFSRLPLAG